MGINLSEGALKKIAVITASRADWGIYLPLLIALQKNKMEFVVIVVGADKSYLDGSYEGLDYLPYINKIIVLGDTMPMLKTTIQTAENNIPIFHIHGGDKTGSIDDKIRYAITAFADYHFPSLPSHAYRLRQMGYPENRIQVVGPLGIYAMKDADFIPDDNLRRGLGLSNKPIIIVLQHPVSNEKERAGQQMHETLEAVKPFIDYEIVVFYPNSEPGSDEMIKIIKQYSFKIFKNLSYLTFISLLKISSVIVGNSSCGLVEAPLFGVPCVNIGTRQTGRLAGGYFYQNYGYEYLHTQACIELALFNKCPPVKNPYTLNVDGCAIIIKTLEET